MGLGEMSVGYEMPRLGDEAETIPRVPNML